MPRGVARTMMRMLPRSWQWGEEKLSAWSCHPPPSPPFRHPEGHTWTPVSGEFMAKQGAGSPRPRAEHRAPSPALTRMPGCPGSSSSNLRRAASSPRFRGLYPFLRSPCPAVLSLGSGPSSGGTGWFISSPGLTPPASQAQLFPQTLPWFLLFWSLAAPSQCWFLSGHVQPCVSSPPTTPLTPSSHRSQPCISSLSPPNTPIHAPFLPTAPALSRLPGSGSLRAPLGLAGCQTPQRPLKPSPESRNLCPAEAEV